MNNKNYKYIYGPVSSWRLGSSLGIDLFSSNEKICTFNCIYCQLGEAKFLTDKRKIFASTVEIINELKTLPSLKIDYITFSGRGEPTLAGNLGQVIRTIKKIRNEKIAVLTNSSLLNRKNVQQDLLLSDFVVAKLDASSQKVWETINKPLETIKFEIVLEAIKDFKGIYKGKLALQIMFMDKNKHYASQIAKIAREISPDEVQINTPLRFCPVGPLSKQEIDIIKKYFEGLNVISVYEASRKDVRSLNDKGTLARRGRAYNEGKDSF